ncbi:MAG TPA: class I tRNA ligase family protein, partial [Chloroflexota bacterium]|nr:class I tRNA ligase family protein [Chloroflexota bacterium]
NVIDPLDLMDEYGTDALRLAMVTGNSAGNDLRLSEQRVEHGRNVANKIWQAARFILTYEPSPPGRGQGEGFSSPELPERWIKSRALAAARTITRLLEQFQLGEAARTVEEFFWGEVCDWYLETVKPRVLTPDHDRGAAAQETLLEVLAVSLRLLHPFMPYVTEEIWQHLRQRLPDLTDTIAMAQWPGTAAGQPVGSESPLEAWDDPAAEAGMALLIDAITKIRNYRSENRIEFSDKLSVNLRESDEASLLLEQRYLIEGLADATVQLGAGSSEAVRLLVGRQCELEISRQFDPAAEKARLQEELRAARLELERAGRQLEQPGFKDRAPQHVIQKAHDRLAAATDRVTKLEQQLQALG